MSWIMHLLFLSSKAIENSFLPYYIEGLQELQNLLNLLTQKLSKSFKKIADLSFNFEVSKGVEKLIDIKSFPDNFFDER